MNRIRGGDSPTASDETQPRFAAGGNAVLRPTFCGQIGNCAGRNTADDRNKSPANTLIVHANLAIGNDARFSVTIP